MGNTIRIPSGGGTKPPNVTAFGWGNSRRWEADAKSESESPVFELPKGYRMCATGAGEVESYYGSTGSFSFQVFGSNNGSDWTNLKSFGVRDGGGYLYTNDQYKYYKMRFNRSSYCYCGGAIWFEKK